MRPGRPPPAITATPTIRPDDEDVDPRLALPLERLGDDQAFEQFEGRLHPGQPAEQLVDRVLEFGVVLLGRDRWIGLQAELGVVGGDRCEPFAKAIGHSDQVEDRLDRCGVFLGRPDLAFLEAGGGLALAPIGIALGGFAGAVELLGDLSAGRGELILGFRLTPHGRLDDRPPALFVRRPRIPVQLLELILSIPACFLVFGVGRGVTRGPSPLYTGLGGGAFADQTEDLTERGAFAPQQFRFEGRR